MLYTGSFIVRLFKNARLVFAIRIKPGSENLGSELAPNPLLSTVSDCHHHYKSLDRASLSHRFISPNESVAPLLIGTMRAQLNMM